MRGTQAKKLRKIAKLDTQPDIPWVLYKDVQTSQFSAGMTTQLYNCGKVYYKTLKHIWKKFK